MRLLWEKNNTFCQPFRFLLLYQLHASSLQSDAKYMGQKTQTRDLIEEH